MVVDCRVHVVDVSLKRKEHLLLLVRIQSAY
jgi:hypothetical protein